MGVFQLGAIVNFLSHPVIVGFTNAAAIIIALSQLNKLLGVAVARSDRFSTTSGRAAAGRRHPLCRRWRWRVGALALMMHSGSSSPRWPGVLIAVVITTR